MPLKRQNLLWITLKPMRRSGKKSILMMDKARGWKRKPPMPSVLSGGRKRIKMADLDFLDSPELGNAMDHAKPRVALLLAGGEGRRMNYQNKGLVTFKGEPLIAHV